MSRTSRLAHAQPEPAYGSALEVVHRRAASDGTLQHLADFRNAFMWQVNPKNLQVTFVTRSIERVLGHSVEAWLGEPAAWTQFIEPDDREAVLTAFSGQPHNQECDIEFRASTADGRIVWLSLVIRGSTDEAGGTTLWCFTTDITDRKQAQEALRVSEERVRELSAHTDALRHQAMHDPLTGLPNRTLLHDRLKQALRAARRSSAPCAVLLIDLDKFKLINDQFGHQVGDAVLRQVAPRLAIALRGSDTTARIGGDEFAAVLPNSDVDGAMRAAQRIVRAVSEPMTVKGNTCAIGASVGIALSPEHGSDAQELLRRADAAMYAAKRSSGGYAFPPDETKPIAPDLSQAASGSGAVSAGRCAGLRAGLAGVEVAIALSSEAVTFLYRARRVLRERLHSVRAGILGLVTWLWVRTRNVSRRVSMSLDALHPVAAQLVTVGAVFATAAGILMPVGNVPDPAGADRSGLSASVTHAALSSREGNFEFRAFKPASANYSVRVHADPRGQEPLRIDGPSTWSPRTGEQEPTGARFFRRKTEDRSLVFTTFDEVADEVYECGSRRATCETGDDGAGG